MPIIVDEVVISVEVASGASGASGAPGAEGAPAASGGGSGGAADRQAIIEECVERVLDVLARREER